MNITQGKPADGWISVEERLPEIGQPVFALEGARVVFRVREWIDEGWGWCDAYSAHHIEGDKWESEAEFDDEYVPTHWMPLPSPPQGKPETGTTTGKESA